MITFECLLSVDLEIDNDGFVRFKSPANSFDREKEANSKVFISVIATDKDDSPKDSDPVLIYLFMCLFVHVVSKTLYCVFILFFFVLCTLYCQFL
jgi:hypothetical protein